MILDRRKSEMQSENVSFSIKPEIQQKIKHKKNEKEKKNLITSSILNDSVMEDANKFLNKKYKRF